MIAIFFELLNKAIKWMTPVRFGLIVIGLLILFGGVQSCRVTALKKEAHRTQTDLNASLSLMNESAGIIKTYKNKLGEAIAKGSVYEMTISTLNATVRNNKQLEFVKHIPDVKKKNLEVAQSFDASFLDESVRLIPVEIPCPDGDSTARRVLKHAYRWEIKDEYNDIAAIVLDTPRFNVRVPIRSVILWERKRFLGFKIGKKQWFQEAFSPNRLIRIDSQLVIRVQRK